MDQIMHGIFPVVQTAVTDDGELDIPSLEKEVGFCIDCGVHGLVFPVLGSEFQYLTEGERQQLLEVVVAQAGGQVPVVAGVAGTSKAQALECARRAATTQADAFIALPPYLSGATAAEMGDYYKAIAQVAQRPVFIQHTQAGLSASFMRQLFEEVEHIDYLKEEAPPSAHQISAVVGQIGDACLGVFGGGHGRWMMSELRRGATGFMPAAELVDVHVQVWDAFQAGDEAGARRLFNQLLPHINLILLLGLGVCKEVLVRRGVLASAQMRIPGSQQLDEEDQREIDAILADLAPLLRQ